jgi:outer membrane protein TolC
MDRVSRRRFPRFFNPRRWALGTALPLLALGCATPVPSLAAPPDAAAPLVARGASGDMPDTLPAPRPTTPQAPSPGPQTAAAPDKALPVGLDTVFRLAQDQNAQVQLAREKVNGAYAQYDVATLSWLPRLYVGPAWYRHEGGIQNEDGTLTHSSTGALFGGMELDGTFDLRQYAFEKVKAERDVWQQKGELSRITTETLQQASETYIDLLQARSEEALAQAQVAREEDLLRFVKNLNDTGYQAEMDTIESDLAGYRQLAARMRQLQQAAAARLAYLLNLGPCTDLVPIDDRLVPFDLIDATPPPCDLVARALAAGPGVRELEGLIGLIQSSIARSQGPSRFLPVFEVRMAEGAFGAGPGDDMRWDNRWDLGLQARWDLSGLATGRSQQRVAESKLQQAHLSLQDLRGKLAAGVQESREAVVSGRAQLTLAQERIKHGVAAYRLHNDVRREPEDKRPIVRELLFNIRSLREAEHDYLDTVSAYDKAQVRLLLLLGPTAPPPAGVAGCR